MSFGFSRRKVVHHPSRNSRRPAPNRRSLAFDCLEDRRLLSGGTVAAAGSNFMVNTTTAGQELTTNAASPRSVAIDNSGNTVAVWADAANNNLLFQLYTKQQDSTGAYYLAPEGSETLVANSGTALGTVMVAKAPTSGDFAVVWETFSVLQKGATYYGNVPSAHAQLFSANGTPMTGAMLVGSSGAAAPESLAMGDNGFDVLYNATPNSQPASWTVQRYTSTGAAEGKPITAAKVSTNFVGTRASIAMDNAGDFEVVWDNVPSTSPLTYTVDAQRFSSAGKAVGSVTQVYQAVTNSEPDADIGMDLTTGNFVIDWGENVAFGSQNATALYAEPISASGTQGTPIEVVTPTATYDATLGKYLVSGALVPAPVAVQPGGAFDMAYTISSQTADDTTGTITTAYHVDGDTFNSTGAPLQSQFQVDSSTNTGYGIPSAAVDSSGDLVVVWNGKGAGNGDTGDVFGQFYVDPPLASTSTSPSTASSPSASGSTTAATDAVFAAYAYPEDDDTLA